MQQNINIVFNGDVIKSDSALRNAHTTGIIASCIGVVIQAQCNSDIPLFKKSAIAYYYVTAAAVKFFGITDFNPADTVILRNSFSWHGGVSEV